MTQSSQLANTLFPLGLAESPGFCNRDAERQQLKENVLSGIHTYIVGSRRFGKTSLVHQTLKELSGKRKPRVHSQRLNLMTAMNDESIERTIREAVGRLVAQFLPKRKRALGELGKLLAAFKPELTLSNSGVSIKLFSSAPPTQSITDVLRALDRVAGHYQRRAVLVFDEFQQFAHIDPNGTLDASVREVCQSCQHVSFVFLGSESRLLADMFENSKRPLYNAASVPLELNRISEVDYIDYIQNAARLRWHSELEENAIAQILHLTDRHTHYVNRLCHELWRAPRKPDSKTVDRMWHELLGRERYQAENSLLSLTLIQRNVLQAIARKPTRHPLAKDYLQKFGVAASTMRATLEALINRDLVRVTVQGNHEVIDPVLKQVINQGA